MLDATQNWRESVETEMTGIRGIQEINTVDSGKMGNTGDMGNAGNTGNVGEILRNQRKHTKTTEIFADNVLNSYLSGDQAGLSPTEEGPDLDVIHIRLKH